MGKKVAYSIIILLFFTLLTIILTYPAVLHLSDKLIGDGVDNYQFAGFQYIASENIKSGFWPFSWSNIWRYPIGFDFSRSLDGVLNTLLGAFFILLTKNYALSFNVSLIVLFVINALCSYLLFKYIGDSRKLGIFGGVAYGLSFYSLARGAGHPNLILTAGFPLFIYSILKLRQNIQSGIFFLGISIIFIFLSSPEYLVILSIFTVFFCLFSLFFNRKWVSEYFDIFKKGFVKFTFMAMSVLLIFFALFSKYVIAILQGMFLFTQHADFNPSIIDYFLPNRSYSLFLKGLTVNPKNEIEATVFIGFVELCLFLLFLLSKVERHVKISIISVVSFFFILSLGTINPDFNLILPYSLLVNFFPFSAVPETGRFFIIFYLFIIIAIVIFLKRFQSKFGTLLITILLLLIIAERLSPSYYLSETQNGKFTAIVKTLPGKAVADIPVFDNRLYILPAYYQKSIVSGYTHWSTDDENSRIFIYKTLPQFICGNFQEKSNFGKQLNLLKQNDIATIVIHKDFRLYWDECLDVLARYTDLFPHLSIIREVKQNQFFHYRWSNDRLKYSFYFPTSGEFIFNDLHFIDFDRNTNIIIKVNEKELDLKNWKRKFNYEYGRWTQRLTPSLSKLRVDKGTFISLEGNQFITKQGFVSIWYSFTPDKKTTEVNLPIQSLEKIYEDDQKEVWKIN